MTPPPHVLSGPRVFRPVAAVSALALLLALGAVAAIFLAGLGHQWGWWHYSTGFRVLAGGALAGVGAALLALAMLGPALLRWRRQRRPALLLAVLAALAIALPAFIVPYATSRQAKSLPRIHDISTDTADPPPFVAVAPLRANAPNPAAYDGPEVAAQQHKAYPDLQSLRLAEAPPAVFAVAEAAARQMGWQIVASEPAQGRLEATATTFLFGFKDDVVVRLRPGEAGTVLDVRSKSRVGRSDIGANAKRIRRFLGILRDSGLKPPP